MRKSSRISLIILSSLSLTACDEQVVEQPQPQLTSYEYMRDCVAQQGDDDRCRYINGTLYGSPSFDDDDGGSGSFVYLGGSYKSGSYTSNLQSGTKPVVTSAKVPTGGFGKTAAVHGSSASS